MTINFAHYDLQEGYVSNWLVGGPQTFPIPADRFREADFETRIIRENYQDVSGISEMPVERGPIDDGIFEVGNYQGVWAYYRCGDDHFVNSQKTLPTIQYLRSWAYAQIMSNHLQEMILKLTANGSADIWLNGRHIHKHESTTGTESIKTSFKEGSNEVLIRFEGIGSPDRRHAIALQLCSHDNPDQPASGLKVQLPTTIRQLNRRKKLERAFDAAYLVQEVFERKDLIALHWPNDFEESVNVMVRLQTPTGRIYGEANLQAKAGERVILSQGYQVPGGPYQIRIMPNSKEYYDDQVRIKRIIPIWVLGREAYSDSYYSDYAARVQEALTSSAFHKGEVFAEIAWMKLMKWDQVDSNLLLNRIAAFSHPGLTNLLDFIGLLGATCRFGGDSQFPLKLKGALETCAIEFGYTSHESYLSESQKFISHTTELLAGQLFPDHTFKDSGKTGTWHRQRGERLAVEWLHSLGTRGFSEWDSPAYFSNVLTALSHLIDLAENEQIWEMAAVVLDKALFTIALNSYHGIYGASQGRANGSPTMGGLLTPTAGITRLIWGAGIFNHHIAGTVSMACLENYETPDIIPEIAHLQRDETWNCERHKSGADQEVNKVTFRTRDYLLSSAQDYHPGEAGSYEHIWQGTLGPAAFVFTNHPVNTSAGGVSAPDFWTGNAVLPRVAQWKDVLVAIHKVPEDDWMGYTHAYFPAYAFDGYNFGEGGAGQRWAFARKGNGYLALTASGGLNFIKSGHSAYRELRPDQPYGQTQVWICHMGRAAVDGSFDAFQSKILSLEIAFHKSSLQMETLRGETISFGWEGPFLRNGEVLPLSGFKHYENSYTTAEIPCSKMEVRTENYLLRLDFEK